MYGDDFCFLHSLEMFCSAILYCEKKNCESDLTVSGQRFFQKYGEQSTGSRIQLICCSLVLSRLLIVLHQLCYDSDFIQYLNACNCSFVIRLCSFWRGFAKFTRCLATLSCLGLAVAARFLSVVEFSDEIPAFFGRRR